MSAVVARLGLLVLWVPASSAAAGLPGAGGAQGSPERVRDLMEQSIREADPCLPCTSAPPGGMDLQVDLVRTVGDGEG